MAKMFQVYGIGQALIPVLPPPLAFESAPNSNQTNYEIGQVVYTPPKAPTSFYMYGGAGNWVLLSNSSGTLDILTGNTGSATPSAGNINILGNSLATFSGSGSTLTLSPTASGYPITPFVVGPSGSAGYQTIQSAINAAHTAGGGVVYIQPGSYTENLTLFTGVDLYGTPAVSQNAGASVTIIGTHTPPTSGHIGFNSICFVSTTNVFSSAAAGSTHIVLLNCESAVENGYFFNLLNWTGILEIYDFNPSVSGAPFAVNDGGINNTGGSTLFMFSAGFGSGTNVMNLSGLCICQATSFGCPVNFQTGSSLNFNEHVFGPVTFSNNSTGTLNTCQFVGGSSPAITMSSSGAIEIATSQVSSSNNPSIAGSGAGVLTLGDIIFTGSNSSIANTLTLAWLPTKTGTTSITGSLTASTTLTATAGAITATNGNFVGTAVGTGILLNSSQASGAASGPVVVNGRSGRATFTSVSIAAAADLTLTITNSAITASTTEVLLSMSGATTGSALSIKSKTASSGSLAIVVTNGTGASTTTADIQFDFLVLNA